MKNYWWKIIACLLILYSIIAGLLIPVPEMEVIGQSIRNLFYHVPMWFAMISMLAVSLVYSILFLHKQKPEHDLISNTAVSIALLFGIIGIITGMIWAKFTWGNIWVNDPKLNGAALGILSYLAYKVLRNSVSDTFQKAKLAAVYNIFAFTIYIVFVFVLPKISGSSIHPGTQNNMIFAPASLDTSLRLVFYPAFVGWILFATWILNLLVRIKKIKVYEL